MAMRKGDIITSSDYQSLDNAVSPEAKRRGLPYSDPNSKARGQIIYAQSMQLMLNALRKITGGYELNPDNSINYNKTYDSAVGRGTLITEIQHYQTLANQLASIDQRAKMGYTGCPGSCTGICTGCVGTCQSGCDGCTGCRGSCEGSCQGSCSGDCQNSCSGQCQTACYDDCGGCEASHAAEGGCPGGYCPACGNFPNALA